MASRRMSTREELERLKRPELQKLAKDHNIKANLKSNTLIEELVRASAAQALAREGPSSPRRDLEGQENRPESQTPKTADSSLGSGHGSPARVPKSKDPQAKPGAKARAKARAGPSRLPGADDARKTADVRGMMMPPGVLAANSDVKGKGRVKKPTYPAPIRGVTGSRLPIAKTVSLESIKADQEGNLSTDPSGSSIADPVASSYELPSPDRPVPHSSSSLLTTLNSRLAKVERAREASRERREKELEELRNELQAARESINVLSEQHDALRSRVDSIPPPPSPMDISDVIERLAKLEEQFRRLGVKKPPSTSSSDADGTVPWEPALPRSQFRTPPNRPDQYYQESRGLAPAAILAASAKRMAAPQTPPPHTRRYVANPDDSPSPTRLPSNAGGILSRPPASAVPTEGSATMFVEHVTGRTSAIEEGSALVDSPKRGRQAQKPRSRVLSEIDDSDGPEDGRPLSKRQRRADSAEREYTVETKEAPVAKLPFPIVPSVSAPSSPLYTAPGTTSRRPPREGSSRGSLRTQPYARRGASRRQHARVSNVDENAEEDPPRNITNVFGATPDPSRVPPLPFVDGTIPVLHLGRPSLSNSIVPETPTSSPSQPQAPSEDTPPASRTRYGTEFGTAMKAKFSE